MRYYPPLYEYNPHYITVKVVQIVLRSNLLVVHNEYSYLGPFIGMRQISKVVIHCTASSDSIDIGYKEINQWHKERGWASPSGVSCGYHYIIRRNGDVERGRDDFEVGAHVKGHNSDSIGIVWVGINEISQEQQASLLQITKAMLTKYDLTIDDVYGHCELYSGKTCPNLDMDHFRAEMVFI